MESRAHGNLIYASLLRYTAETAALRDRALERLVLSALSGSAEESPFRVGRIASQLTLGPDQPSIRTEIIQETLNRLIEAGKVQRTELKQRHAYYLTPVAVAELSKLLKAAEDLFSPVLDKLLENTSHHVSFDIGKAVCHEFISETFAQFGGHIARMSAGELEPAAFARIADVAALFHRIAKSKQLSPESSESLLARCIGFLKSNSPEDVKLKFYLTQGYCFAQLLGLQDGKLNPLFAQTFSGSIFYLDTNVLLVGLLGSDGHIDQFNEMLKVAKRNSITLKVTRATINEIRNVAADRHSQIRTLLDEVPTELVARAEDQFFNAFLRAKKVNPNLSHEEFFEVFDHVSSTVSGQWGIEVQDEIEDEVLSGRDVTHVATVMQESALTTRGWDKSEAILRHDICHYFLIVRERNANPKTWFLTRDRSLTHAAAILKQPQEPGFCFSLLGFLQSISPFVTTASEEHSLSNYFSTLLKEQIFPTDRLFDPRELMLLVEMQQDVLATPKDKLLEALDYVKHTILQGQPYVQKESTKVALGLRTFLASSAEERRKELEEQARRLEVEAQREREAAETERQLRDEATSCIKRQADEIADLEERNAELLNSVKRYDTRAERERLFLTICGFVSASILWHFSPRLVHLVSRASATAPISHAVVACLGIGLFSFPAWMFLKLKVWPTKTKSVLMACVLIAALALSNVLDKDVWANTWPGILDAALLVGGFLFTVLAPRKVFGDGSETAAADETDLVPNAQ